MMSLLKTSELIGCTFLRATDINPVLREWNLICKRDGRRTDTARCRECKRGERPETLRQQRG